METMRALSQHMSKMAFYRHTRSLPYEKTFIFVLTSFLVSTHFTVTAVMLVVKS